LLLGPDPRERLRRPAAPKTGALRKHVLIMKELHLFENEMTYYIDLPQIMHPRNEEHSPHPPPPPRPPMPNRKASEKTAKARIITMTKDKLSFIVEFASAQILDFYKKNSCYYMITLCTMLWAVYELVMRVVKTFGDDLPNHEKNHYWIVY